MIHSDFYNYYETRDSLFSHIDQLRESYAKLLILLEKEVSINDSMGSALAYELELIGDMQTLIQLMNKITQSS